MNELTVVDRGGVKHPEIMTIDKAQDLLDTYGVGGTAVKIPGGVDLKKFLGRCDGGWYYDNAALSGTTNGPIKDMVYYTVINGGIAGNRAIVASSHGNNLWIAEVYGDVFRGWVTFARPDDVHNWIDTAIDNHEKSVNHPYATEDSRGMIEIASPAEAISKTEATRAMTSVRVQNLLDTYGIGNRSVQVPAGVNLATYFNSLPVGFYHIDGASAHQNHPTGTEVWGEIIVTAHEVNNYRGLIAMMADGTLYNAAVTAGSFTGWHKKIELGDLPIASTAQRGIVQLYSNVDSTSNTLAATPGAVKIANDNANTRVPQTRRVNGKALTSDITITAADLSVWTRDEADARYMFKTDSPVPAGMPIPWGKPTAPAGYLIMMGQGISAAYPKLQSVYGSVLPDLRGLVIRGLDLGRGLDAGRTVLSYQYDTMQNATGEFCADVSSNSAIGKFVSGAFYDNGWAGTPSDGGTTWNQEVRRIALDLSRVVRTSDETRMKNIAFTYIVKAE